MGIVLNKNEFRTIVTYEFENGAYCKFRDLYIEEKNKIRNHLNKIIQKFQSELIEFESKIKEEISIKREVILNDSKIDELKKTIAELEAKQEPCEEQKSKLTKLVEKQNEKLVNLDKEYERKLDIETKKVQLNLVSETTQEELFKLVYPIFEACLVEHNWEDEQNKPYTNEEILEYFKTTSVYEEMFNKWSETIPFFRTLMEGLTNKK